MPDLLIVASEHRLEIFDTPLIVASADLGRLGPDQDPVAPHIFHFNVLCGENGWWVEFGWCDEGDCYADLPDRYHDNWGKTLEDAIELITLTSMREDAPIVPEYVQAEGGLEMGTWLGHDGEAVSEWPERYEWSAVQEESA